jgi:hypothetical protein
MEQLSAQKIEITTTTAAEIAHQSLIQQDGKLYCLIYYQKFLNYWGTE